MRRPLWRPSLSSRVLAFSRIHAHEQVTPKRAILGLSLFLCLLGLYVYTRASLNSIVIEPFSVPKRYEDTGLTPEVMSRLIADALVDLEEQAHSGMRKDSFALSSDPSPFPDIEVPGTKFGLRT